MYEDKIKKALFEKIHKLYEVIAEQCDIEEDNDDYDDDDTYLGLVSQEMDLRDEIDALILDTKYAPLTGLTDMQIKELNTFIEIGDLSIEQIEKNIEKHLDYRLLTLKEAMKQRINQIEPLRLTAYLDRHIRYLYGEVIRCYVYGAFEASCVLARAITEYIAKKHIENEGYTNMLSGKNKTSKTMSMPEILEKVLSIPKDVVSLYKKVGNKADNILHKKGEKAEEKDALETIKYLQNFIEKFPKSL